MGVWVGRGATGHGPGWVSLRGRACHGRGNGFERRRDLLLGGRDLGAEVFLRVGLGHGQLGLEGVGLLVQGADHGGRRAAVRLPSSSCRGRRAPCRPCPRGRRPAAAARRRCRWCRPWWTTRSAASVFRLAKLLHRACDAEPRHWRRWRRGSPPWRRCRSSRRRSSPRPAGPGRATTAGARRRAADAGHGGLPDGTGTMGVSPSTLIPADAGCVTRSG